MVAKRSSKKHAVQKSSVKAAKKVEPKGRAGKAKKAVQVQVSTKKSSRPADEVVTYAEQEYELKEVAAEGTQVLIGPPWLTRFERARITGARSLQLSLGAPSLIRSTEGASSSILLAVAEIEHKSLPISIRRILPNGLYQDIPIDWLK